MEAKSLITHHGKALLYEDFFPEPAATELFSQLREQVPWRQEPIKMFGKEIMQPRMTCWFSDPGISYSYSGITMNAHPWIPPLLEIKARIEQLAGVRFNGALLNFYRDGNDSMGWHRDNEKELGKNPVIASVSFGSERLFQFRDHLTKKESVSVNLSHGSLLIMSGESQQYWEHRIPKQPGISAPRVNITFRIIGLALNPAGIR
ncbi:alpha-ketoglutarate-dependent dioxygenase AlkB family protein [Flavitalea antarctica]